MHSPLHFLVFALLISNNVEPTSSTINFDLVRKVAVARDYEIVTCLLIFKTRSISFSGEVLVDRDRGGLYQLAKDVSM